jgi:hypothetical protein
LEQKRFDARGRRGTAGQIEVDVNDFVERHNAFQQSRDDASLYRNLLVEICALNVRALKHIFGVAQPELIANGGNISRDRTVSEGDDIACAFTNFVSGFEMFLVTDRAFDEASIDIMRVFLDINDGAENEIDFLGEFEERLVEIEK